MEFFELLHKRNVEYVLLRWWHDLPEIPEGEDMDILIKDEHRDLINDLVTFRDNRTGLKCDIYTVSGCKYGSHKSLPYFQAKLARTLLHTRVMYRGAYVPSPVPYFASLAYHAVFHKGYGSGLPGFDKTVSLEVEHEYTSILTEQARELNLDIDVTVQGLFDWLTEQGFAPADDTLSKLAEIKPELAFLQKSLYCDARGGEVMVYVIRERLLKDELLEDFKHFLKDSFQFDVIDVRLLNPSEMDVCTALIRGGKWDNGPFKYSGGAPVALVIAYDYHPAPPSSAELKKQPRTTNGHNLHAKYKFRDLLNNLGLKEGHYNGVHSADNEHDAWYYISLLGEAYTNKIAAEVEIRRERYARIWPVKKLVSANAISKVELISYGDDLAVKKTFRLGNERYFEKELYAAKALSKEFAFIPPLLEAGDGYIVVPYLENVLDNLAEPEKKALIASKENEILAVINNLYNKGLILSGFTPACVVITPGNKLYCSDFTTLQKHDEQGNLLANISECYSGKTNSGTLNLKTVWEPYLDDIEKKLAGKTQVVLED
ncbi:hypothetical protein [uncultured Pontibacter sp.]|uniref:hypothetical protein n=1 Tax=uncultured Pontibacter sp. TaxID=453356 RepID=UPI00262B412E|nr:hypothetical protein [uncultured Pontibacter sp.]